LSLSARPDFLPAIRRRAAAVERPLTFWDQAAFWASLACGLGALAPGAFLVPANSLDTVLVAAIGGSLLASVLLSISAGTAAREGRSLQEFFEAALGWRAGSAANVLLFARHVVWIAFLLALSADAAAFLLGRPEASGVKAAVAIALGAGALGFAALGPRLLLPTLVKWVLAPAALGVIVIVGLSSYLEMGIPELLSRRPAGGWPSFWQGTDLVALSALAWLPAAGSVSLHAGSQRAAWSSVMLGFALPLVLLTLIGAVYLPAVNVGESWELLSAVPAAPLALLMLITLETDGLVLLTCASQREGAHRLVWSAGAVALGVALAANLNISVLEQVAYAAALLFLPPVLLWWRQSVRHAALKASPLAFLVAWAIGFLTGVYAYGASGGPLRGLERALDQLGISSGAGLFTAAGVVVPAVAVTLLSHAALSRLAAWGARR
jgi:hypothetical protein